MKRTVLIPAIFLTLATALPAAAQTVTLTVNNVHSSEGIVLANLCEQGAQFPGMCMSYRSMAKAVEGVTTLSFDHVPNGRYAIQAFHDEDGDMIPNVPKEGYAFGNDAGWPPTFDKAAITVSGNTPAAVTMMYMQSGPSAGPAVGRSATAPEGATRTDVRENGLNAVFYRPKGDQPVPVLIMLGGSEGGLQAASGVSAGFAGHGYAVLAVAYFMDDGLPKTLENIPLEYFDRAVDWVKAQPGLDADRIGVIGYSRGSEAALLLASRRPEIKAVAAFAPSGIVWQGLNFDDPAHMGPAWTVGGKPLPFIAPDGTAYVPGGPMKPMFEHAISQADTRPETEIAVEKINGPVLLISGKADAMWPSSAMSERIVKRLHDKNFGWPVEHLSYEGAGHLVFMGDPTSNKAKAIERAPANPMLGGTSEANMAAWTDNWPKAIAFFDAALKE